MFLKNFKDSMTPRVRDIFAVVVFISLLLEVKGKQVRERMKIKKSFPQVLHHFLNITRKNH